MANLILIRITLALLFFVLSFSPIAEAQKKINPTASEKRGDLCATIQEYGNAEVEYMDVLSSGSIDIISYDRVNIKLAATLYNTRRYSEADKRFETVFVRNKKAFTPEFGTAYVSTLIRLGKYQRAIDVAEIFSQNPLYKLYKPLQNLRAGLEYQTNLPAVVPYKVTNSPINVPGSNYAATHYTNGLIFVHHDNDERSLVKGAQFYLYDGNKSEVYNKIPHTLQAGPGVFDKTNNLIIYTDNRYLGKGFVRELKDQRLITNPLRLIELNYNPKTEMWENPKDVFKDKTMYSTCHPSVTDDGKRMYFSANFDDAVGRMDIYMCGRVGKGWSKPINLGSYVNTSYDEMYPYIYQNRLYFVSNGHEGLGGMDIYYVELDSSGMPIPETLVHMPYPINTIYNDYAFTHNTDAKGYFSSDRPEGRNLDTIYEWVEEEEELPDNTLFPKAAITARPNPNTIEKK
ncbi:MAG: hypothetical protein LBG19_09140 [Prevotellaceae bacterium]|jgi:hypothetical protein|nr:hypothetical protein [Prevotellaceae bacterium]